jgi:hypothetical protein
VISAVLPSSIKLATDFANVVTVTTKDASNVKVFSSFVYFILVLMALIRYYAIVFFPTTMYMLFNRTSSYKLKINPFLNENKTTRQLRDTFLNRLNLYSNYLDNPQNVDIDYQMHLVMK